MLTLVGGVFDASVMRGVIRSGASGSWTPPPLPSVFLLLPCFAACASSTAATSDGRIPLNLDFARPGIADARVPWGWQWQGLAAADVRAEIILVSRELQLARAAAGAPVRAIYDFGADFAGRRLRLGATITAAKGTAARARLGLMVLHTDGQVTESWSLPTDRGSCSVALDTGSTAFNVHGVVEYAGNGTIRVSPLQLAVDDRTVESPFVPDQPPPDAAAVDWARSHAIRLATSAPGPISEDLEALGPLLRDATFVLLGESTHGTSEFFALKHRIARWLLQQQGFAVFALEDHADAARAVDAYVHGGPGTAEQAISKLFGVWHRQEMLDLVIWLRAAIAAGDVRARFVGIDAQVPLGALAAIEAFAARYDPGVGHVLATELGAMRAAWTAGWYPRRTEQEHRHWIEASRRLLQTVTDRQAGYETRAGRPAAAQVLYDARLVWQSATISGTNDMRVRDRFMADNLDWIHAHSPAGTRIVVWTHNTHVRLDEQAMGQHLERLHPGRVAALGLFTYEGDYAAFDGRAMRSYPLWPGPPGSIEALLDACGLPVMALDLRPPEPLPAGLTVPLLHRNIGLWPADLGFYKAPLARGFTALLFVRHTTATKGVATP